MTKNSYDLPDEIVWVSYSPDFFFGKSIDRFDVYDEQGKQLGFVLHNAGKGWYAHKGECCYGPFATRALSLKEGLLGEKSKVDLTEIARQSNKIIYGREIVLIQPHPLKGARLSLDRDRHERAGGELSNWTSIAAGVVQTSPTGVEHAVVCEDNQDMCFRATEAADEFGLLPENRTILALEDFNAYLSCYTSSMNNIDNIRALAVLNERLAPDMRFIPAHLIPVMRNGEQLLGRMFLRNDFTGFQALMKVGDDMCQPKKMLFDSLGLEETEYSHCAAGWYAIRSVDRAVEAKMRAPSGLAVEIHVLSKEEMPE